MGEIACCRPFSCHRFTLYIRPAYAAHPVNAILTSAYDCKWRCKEIPYLMLPNRDHAPHPIDEAPSEDDQALLNRVRSGDIETFELLVRRNIHRLVDLARYHVGSREAAEDLVQDVFLSIWRRRDRWVVSTSISTYLIGAVRKRVVAYRVSARREDRRIARVPVEDHLPAAEQLFPGGADDRLNESELAAAYARAMQQLPDRCREVFLLQRQQHMTYREVALTLGISVKTVEIHMGKALAVLRRTLADWIGGGPNL
jgi:RNA polymerase sigma-70 factor, ECF subfamily